MIEEIWVPILETTGLIEISNMGRVRSYKKLGAKSEKIDTPRFIKPCRDGMGYYNFSVMGVNNKPKVLMIHREVAKHFLPNPFNYKIVRHLDDIKENNFASNLAWGTFKDNREDGIRNKKHFHKKGVRAAQPKLNELQVVEIFKSSKNNCQIAREYGVTESTISKIKLGRGWNHVTGLKRIK